MKELPITFKVEKQQVVGMLHLPAGASRAHQAPAVLFLHGFTGSKVEAHRMFVKCARALAGAGMAALRFDFRGSGDSEGDFSQVTVAREIKDAQTAMKYLRRRPEIDGRRIGLLGMSMGGLVGSYLLGAGEKVSATALWAPVGLPQRLVDARTTDKSRQQFESMGVADMNGWAVGRGFVDDLLPRNPLLEIVKSDAPVLLLHGDQDETVPVADSIAYADALRAARRMFHLHVMGGANHAFGSLEWETELIAMTLEWFRMALFR